MLKYNYKNYQVLYQHILLNVFINSVVGKKVFNKKLILNNDYKLIFNLFFNLPIISKNFKSIELLINSFDFDKKNNF
jgi:hypothetical protein